MTEPSNDPNAAEHDLKKSSVPANAATLAAAAETLPSGIKSDTDQLPQAQAEGSSEAFEVVQVDWGKPHDPKSPMDWSKTRKWACVGLIGSVTLNASMATTIITPGTPKLMAEFHNDNEQLGSLVTSIYVVAVVFGPLLWAPLCEMYGRYIVLNVTGVFFLVFNVASAVSTDLAMLIVFRFFVGLFGCVSAVLGGGVIADIMEPQDRATALSGWQVGPLLGPVIGPIVGGYLSESLGWRWTFWLICILQSPLVIGCLLIMRETYAPVLLERKAARLRKETGNPNYRSKFDTGRSRRDLVGRTFLRPAKMLFGSPVVALLALVISIANGYVYFLLTTFTDVFQGQYGFSTGSAGLAYIGIGVGFMAGLAFTGPVADKLSVRMTAKHGERKPEYRLPPMLVGAFSMPVGLFLYGWTAQYKVHWIVPIIGTTIVGFGVICIFLPVQAYLIDAFTVYAASAGATSTIVRSIFGAVLPLAGPSLYGHLGLGWGNSVLGFIALATAAVPIFLLRYGERIRTAPRFRLQL